MNIAVIGEKTSFEEVRKKLGEHQFTHYTTLPADVLDDDIDTLFHFTIDENPEDLEVLRENKKVVIFLNSVKTTLAELLFTYGSLRGPVAGFNGLPTFFEGEYLELALFNEPDQVKKVLSSLELNYLSVQDRVGMIIPRVISMIINEAYFTVQEGTASKKDIDLGMKLGTNYPYGPFEWAERIGTHHIYELLEALYLDTKDERYKICPLLKQEYLAAGIE